MAYSGTVLAFIWTILRQKQDSNAPTLLFPCSDYGSFICGFAVKFRLSVIDHVHNTGKSLATFSFQASHLESVYLESGEHPLALLRNLLLYTYAAKFATQPNHPSHGEVFM